MVLLFASSAWVNRFLFPVSSLYAGVHMKAVTEKRIEESVQPGTEVINKCLWNRAENTVDVCSWVTVVVNYRVCVHVKHLALYLCEHVGMKM